MGMGLEFIVYGQYSIFDGDRSIGGARSSEILYVRPVGLGTKGTAES